jgi:hypothetical protein
MKKKKALDEIPWCPVLLALKTAYCKNSRKVQARPDRCPTNIRENRKCKKFTKVMTQSKRVLHF